jgi:predicted GIY-YIG superfamily endonuclease
VNDSATVAGNWQSKPGYLYRYWSDRGTLLYIGISVNAVARLAQHRGKPWFPRIARIDVKKFDTYEEAERAELKAICYEGPIHNIKGPRDAKDVGPALAKLRAAQKRRTTKPKAKASHLKVRAKFERDRLSGRIPDSMSFDKYYSTPELSGVESEW